MSQFIGTSMKRGHAGELTRGYFDHTVESRLNDGSVKAFGVPVVVKGDKVGATTATSEATLVYGFSVRQYGQANVDGTQDQPAVAIMRRGYMAVPVAGGTPAFGTQVYLDSTGKVTAEQSSNTAIPGCLFLGAKDADGLVEISFNI